MMNVCILQGMGKNEAKKRMQLISKVPNDSLALSRYSTIRKVNTEQEVVQLEIGD